MANSPTLGLTLMSASQAQKEVVFNEFLLAIDSLFRGVVINSTLTTPPSSPSEGDTYIIGPGATGAWSGQDHNVTFYFNGWQFVTAKDQMRMYDQAATVWRVFHASTTNWDAEPASTVSVLNDLTNVSGTPSDGQVLTFKASDGRWEPANPVYTAALRSLTDVNVTEGSAINGYALLWNNADSKWEAGAVLTAKPAVLTLPDVTTPTGIRDGWIMVYNATGPGVKFVDPTSITLVRSLSNVGDVAYPSGGSGAIASGAYLQWNGAAWVPSTSAVSISVQSLSNGPGPFTGKGGEFVRVDSTETNLEYVSLSLAALPDVNVTEGLAIDGYVLSWNYATGKWVPATHGISTVASLADVNVTAGSAIDGYALAWNNANSRWEAKALSWGNITGKPSFATVATSGAYSDLTGRPSLATVATSGAYRDLSGQPTSGSWSLAALADVTMSPGAGTDGYVVYWDNASSKFKLKTPSGALSTLYDTSILSPATGQMLIHNGSAWMNKAAADLPCYENGSVSGSITLNRANGETQIVTLGGNVTGVSISNWGASGTLSKMTLIIKNTGGYTFAFPTAKWVGGSAPTMTAGSGKTDIYTLISPDNGATVYGNIVGQNFY